MRVVKILSNSSKRIQYKHGYLQLLSEFLDSIEEEIVVIESCGFCKEFHRDTPYNHEEGEERTDECSLCPLYQENMCHTSGFYRQYTFWHMVDQISEGEIEDALIYAEQILERIKIEPVSTEEVSFVPEN